MFEKKKKLIENRFNSRFYNYQKYRSFFGLIESQRVPSKNSNLKNDFFLNHDAAI